MDHCFWRLKCSGMDNQASGDFYLEPDSAELAENNITMPLLSVVRFYKKIKRLVPLWISTRLTTLTPMALVIGRISVSLLNICFWAMFHLELSRIQQGCDSPLSHNHSDWLITVHKHAFSGRLMIIFHRVFIYLGLWHWIVVHIVIRSDFIIKQITTWDSYSLGHWNMRHIGFGSVENIWFSHL